MIQPNHLTFRDYITDPYLLQVHHLMGKGSADKMVIVQQLMKISHSLMSVVLLL
jgi:hypothetical protein